MEVQVRVGDFSNPWVQRRSGIKYLGAAALGGQHPDPAPFPWPGRPRPCRQQAGQRDQAGAQVPLVLPLPGRPGREGHGLAPGGARPQETLRRHYEDESCNNIRVNGNISIGNNISVNNNNSIINDTSVNNNIVVNSNSSFNTTSYMLWSATL